MASSISIQVGPFSATFTPASADTKVADVLRRFIISKADPPPEGATQAQINQHYLDQSLAEIVRHIKQEAVNQSMRELQEEIELMQQQAQEGNEL
jgi:hypothetical protein